MSLKGISEREERKENVLAASHSTQCLIWAKIIVTIKSNKLNLYRICSAEDHLVFTDFLFLQNPHVGKDFGRWRPSDDLSLITAVQQVYRRTVREIAVLWWVIAFCSWVISIYSAFYCILFKSKQHGCIRFKNTKGFSLERNCVLRRWESETLK